MSFLISARAPSKKIPDSLSHLIDSNPTNYNNLQSVNWPQGGLREMLVLESRHSIYPESVRLILEE